VTLTSLRANRRQQGSLPVAAREDGMANEDRVGVAEVADRH